MRRDLYKQGEETIQLLRGGELVSSLAGSFGSALRETRLTALLGYLISLDPAPFVERFGFQGDVQEVVLEAQQAAGRADIKIETNKGVGLIEAKVDTTNPSRQAKRYEARWKVLLTQYDAPRGKREQTRMRFLKWEDLVPILRKLSRSRCMEARFVSRDLMNYLEEHKMINTKESVEVYAREINEPDSASLYLGQCMYICIYRDSGRLAEALYFAPHFGNRIAGERPEIRPGISYVSRIEEIRNVESWEDLRDYARDIRGRRWLAEHKVALQRIRRWRWRNNKFTVLFLGPPRLVFNPPIRKEALQKASGILVQRFYSFDKLFAAWGELPIKK